MAQRRQCQSARVRCLPFSMEGEVRPPYEARCHDNGWKPRYRPYSWAEQPHQNIRAGSEEPSASPTQPFSWKRRRSPETAAQGFEVRAAVLRQWPPRAVGPHVHARYLRYLAQCLNRGGPPPGPEARAATATADTTGRRADGQAARVEENVLARPVAGGRVSGLLIVVVVVVVVTRGTRSRDVVASMDGWPDLPRSRWQRCRGRGAGAADDDGLLRVFCDAGMGSIISRTLQTQTR